jgi:hypothetical protein
MIDDCDFPQRGVWKAKAMLEARIVAARIHTSAGGAHGTADDADRIEASSQGGLKILAMPTRGCRYAPEQDRIPQ